MKKIGLVCWTANSSSSLTEEDSANYSCIKSLERALNKRNIETEIFSIPEFPYFTHERKQEAQINYKDNKPGNYIDVMKDILLKLASFDAVAFSVPSYNRGLPGSFKNTIDW